MGASESKTSKGSYPRQALILSHEKYLEDRQDFREGNQENLKRLRECLPARGFEVLIHEDPTVDKVKSIINENASADHSGHDCLLVIVTTHGERQGRLAAYDNDYQTADVWRPYLKCPSLQGKPKIFLFNACRGKQRGKRAISGGNKKGPKSSLPQMPHEENFLILYTTMEAQLSMRGTTYGAVYLDELCNELDTSGGREGLFSFLAKVHDAVVLRGNMACAQTPNYSSFLHNSIRLPARRFIKGAEAAASTVAERGLLRSDDAKTAAPEDSDTEFDAPRRGSENGKTQKITEYEWCLKKGRAIIIYKNEHGNQASKLSKSFEKVGLFPRKFLVQNCDDIDETLDSERKDPILKDVGCLLVVVLADLIERTDHNACYTWCIEHDEYPVHDAWAHFRSAKCHALHNKPKIFLFVDPAADTVPDAGKKSRSKRHPIHADEAATEYTDLLIARAFNTAFLDSLNQQLMKGGGDMLEMLTEAIKKSREVPGKYHSHFDSSLRLNLFIPAQSPVARKRTATKSKGKRAVDCGGDTEMETDSDLTAAGPSKRIKRGPSSSSVAQDDETSVKQELVSPQSVSPVPASTNGSSAHVTNGGTESPDASSEERALTSQEPDSEAAASGGQLVTSKRSQAESLSTEQVEAPAADPHEEKSSDTNNVPSTDEVGPPEPTPSTSAESSNAPTTSNIKSPKKTKTPDKKSPQKNASGTAGKSASQVAPKNAPKSKADQAKEEKRIANKINLAAKYPIALRNLTIQEEYPACIGIMSEQTKQFGFKWIGVLEWDGVKRKFTFPWEYCQSNNATIKRYQRNLQDKTKKWFYKVRKHVGKTEVKLVMVAGKAKK